MSNTMDELYNILSEQAIRDTEYLEQRRALSRAASAVAEEIESLCGEELIPLLDVMGCLDARKQDLHSRAVFRIALQHGMELGRMSVS